VPHARTYQPRRLPFWTVTDAIARIGRQRRARPGSMWLDVFLLEHDAGVSDQALHHKAALAATLIAGLELARDGSLTLDQDRPWEPIRVA
jgi:segregation and condensation protein A